MAIRWKLKKLLDDHDVTPYRLAQVTGEDLSISAVYRLTNKDVTRFDASSLDAIIRALRTILETDVVVADLLEYVPDNEAD